MVPVIPDTAPFTPEQRAWLNGYLAGIFSRGPAPAAAVAPSASPATPPLVPLTILFGSQTGTAEALARRAATAAGKRGFAAMVLDMGETDLERLTHEQNVLVITSTYGEGEPPDNARALHAALSAASEAVAPSARSSFACLRFSVCALGDSNYAQFCRCGKDLDAFLEKLGATRIAPRVDCDLDQEAKFLEWLDQSLGALRSTPGATPPAAGDASLSATSNPAPRAQPGFSRSHPHAALVLSSRNLTGPGSAKQVHHVELDLRDSVLTYEPGDALGILPHNCPERVTEVLAALGCDGEEAVPGPEGTTTSLRHALTEQYELGKPSPELLARFGGDGSGGTAVALHHVIDVLQARVDVKLAPAEFVGALRRLQPRLYSISSSPRAHPGQVHLTVGAVRYAMGGRSRKGVCSTFLAERVVPGETRVGVYVHANKAFRPPADGDAPMVMIGPGTGVAPFRAFLHERRATGQKGRNWLFFGDQRAATDFLYRDELLAMHTDGLLSRLDLAWSRDQAGKVYVQTRMLEHAAELYAWLDAGAHLYVCGDASRMARDVDAALHTVVERAGGKNPAAAAEYVQGLRTAKRYRRDVY